MAVKEYRENIFTVYNIPAPLVANLEKMAAHFGFVGGRGLQPDQPNRSEMVRRLAGLPPEAWGELEKYIAKEN